MFLRFIVLGIISFSINFFPPFHKYLEWDIFAGFLTGAFSLYVVYLFIRFILWMIKLFRKRNFQAQKLLEQYNKITVQRLLKVVLILFIIHLTIAFFRPMQVKIVSNSSTTGNWLDLNLDLDL